ncbi:hypothetical protein ACR6HW_01430 [Fusibacter sp. JL298sf-3]
MKFKRLLGFLLSTGLVLSLSFGAVPVNAATSDSFNTLFEPFGGTAFMKKAVSASNSYEKLIKSFKSDGQPKSTDYPDYFGGAYIDNAGQLVVLVEANHYADAGVKQTVERIIGNDQVTYQSAPYSLKHLQGLIENINGQILNGLGGSAIKNIDKVFLDDAKSKVVVELRKFSPDKVREFKKQIVNDPGVELRKMTTPLEAHTDINPGNRIKADGTGSMGYRAMRNGEIGFVTAGHVARTVGKDVSYNNTVVAQTRVTRNRGQIDAAFCAITNPGYEPTNTINNTGGQLSTNLINPPVGMPVVKTGINGPSVGRVTSTNFGGVVSGTYHVNLTAAQYASAPGDSGGLIFTGDPQTGYMETAGIHVGSSNLVSAFCKAEIVNQMLGLTRY